MVKNLVSYFECICTGREDKLNADNRSVVINFQQELAQQIGSLCSLVDSSMSQQNEHLRHVEDLCRSFLDIHDKVLLYYYFPG